MNWLWFITLGIIAIFAFKGHKDGFIKTVFQICSLAITLILTVTISPYVSKALQNSNALQGYVSDTISKTMELNQDSEQEKKQVSEQTKAIEDLPIPQSLKDSLIENNNSEVYKALAINTFKDYIVNYITCIIINAISFVLTFVIIGIILFILAHTLDIISKLPIINGLNKTAGLLVGVLHGFIIIWILCIVITACNSMPWGQDAYAMINESKMLSAIYNNNLLLNVVTNIAKVLF